MLHFIETLVSGFESFRSGILRLHDKASSEFDDFEVRFARLSENMDRLSVSIATRNSMISEATRKAEYPVSMTHQQQYQEQQQPQQQQQEQFGNSVRKGIMEFKVVQSLEPLTGEKAQFRQWHLKAMNAMSQVNAVYGQIMKTLETEMDTGKKPDEVAATLVSHFSEYGQFSLEFYCLLMEKAEGNAFSNIRSGKESDGVSAYLILYRWFTDISG
jgi:hypothetical protein